MYTVEKMLEAFSDFHLLTNTTTQIAVTSVSVMDAPDIQKWMKGGEFLITSGFTLANRVEEFEQLILDLNHRKIAALGIKVSRFMYEVPQDILYLANELDFNIIEIPEHYAFTDIITPVLSEIVNYNYRQLELSEEINRKFLQIGVADISYDKILGLLAQYLSDDIYYLDLASQKIFCSSGARDDITVADLQAPSFTSFDITYQKIHYGILYVFGEPKRFQERMAITHAITMFRLSIQTLLSSRRYESQRRNDFLSDLVLNNIKTREEIDFRSQEYGWKLDDGVFCAIFHLDPKRPDLELTQANAKHSQFEAIQADMKKRCKDCYYIIFSNYIVFLIVGIIENAKRDYFLGYLPGFIQKFSNNDYAVTIGVGNSYRDINDSHKSYNEAMKAVTIGRSLYGSGSYYQYSKLSIYDSFVALTSEEMDRIPDFQIIEKLNHLDKQTGTELIKTLAALIDSDWKMSDASKQLYIHYNTMKYRISRLREISHWSFVDREEKFQIEYAYKVFLIHEKSKGQPLATRNVLDV